MLLERRCPERLSVMADKNNALQIIFNGNFKEGFEELAEAFEAEGSDENLISVLRETFFAPNLEQLVQNFNNNSKQLQEYPFIFEKRFVEPEQNRYVLFPLDESLYYVYDKHEKKLFPIEVNSDRETKYFFKDLDDPLLVENEFNEFNLKFLDDNVRDSRDFAGDNHIYLWYENTDMFSLLLYYCDLKLLLEDRKFVFLIGKGREKYPINFKSEFGIDYSGMVSQNIRLEEVKRFCLWYKHAYSGSALCRGILSEESYIQFISGFNFDTYSTVDGKPLYIDPEFKEIMSNPEYVFTQEKLLEIIESEKFHIAVDNLKDYMQWLKTHYAFQNEFTVKELFCGYFLFQYEKRKINPRIVPMLLFDPHMWDTSIYNNITVSFPYFKVLTCVREPVQCFGRSYIYGLAGWNEFQTKYLLAMDYCHTQFMNSLMLTRYYGFRFEDLKNKPENMCREICKELNVPFESNMLEVEAPMKDKETGEVIKGFDKKSLHRDVSGVLSEFDQLRLKIFYDPILRYYGYPTFPFEEHPLSEDIVRKLFSYPFRFEYANLKLFKNAPSPNVFHEWIQEVIQKYWKQSFTVPKLILPTE